MEIDVDSCVICGNGFEEPLDATTVKRGIPKLIECAKKFGDTNLASHLTKQKNMKPVVGKVLVHEGCRYEYTNPATNIITSKRQSSANSPSIEPSPKRIRSGKNNFNWKRDCFFCCEPVKFDPMHPDRCKHSRKVNGKEASVNMRYRILKQCEQRQDKCGKDVRACLAGAYDLVAEEAVYHSMCRVKFYDSESISSNKGCRSTLSSSVYSFRHVNGSKMKTIYLLRRIFEEESICHQSLLTSN